MSVHASLVYAYRYNALFFFSISFYLCNKMFLRTIASSATRAAASTSTTAAPGSRVVLARAFASATSDEVELLESLLAAAKAREAEAAAAAAAGDGDDDASGPKFTIGTFNALSAAGMATFPTNKYEFTAMADNPNAEAHGIVLRSHKLDSSEVPQSVRAVARAGSGTNNVCVADLTERAFPSSTRGLQRQRCRRARLVRAAAVQRHCRGHQHVHKIFSEDGNDAAKVKKRVEAEKQLSARAGKRSALLDSARSGPRSQMLSVASVWTSSRTIRRFRLTLPGACAVIASRTRRSTSYSKSTTLPCTYPTWKLPPARRRAARPHEARRKSDELFPRRDRGFRQPARALG